MLRYLAELVPLSPLFPRGEESPLARAVAMTTACYWLPTADVTPLLQRNVLYNNETPPVFSSEL